MPLRILSKPQAFLDFSVKINDYGKIITKVLSALAKSKEADLLTVSISQPLWLF